MSRDISQEIAAIQAASRGSEVRQPIVDALNKMNSGTLPVVSASDAKKILVVNSQGQWVASNEQYVPTPTGTQNITQNGTYDVTDKASAQVNVQPDLETLSVTQNGTYTPSAGKDGFDEVNVNVSGGSSVLVSKTITQNGTYDPHSDNADGYSDVTVNVQGYPEPTGSLTITQNGTYNIKDYASVIVNVAGAPTFSGDGREYFWQWKYNSESGWILLEPDGTITKGSYNDEMDGTFLYKAANSDVVVAKSAISARSGTATSIGSYASFASGATVSQAKGTYDRIIEAADDLSTTGGTIEVAFNWVLSSSTEKCLIKMDDTFLGHTYSAAVGTYIQASGNYLSMRDMFNGLCIYLNASNQPVVVDATTSLITNKTGILIAQPS